MSEDDFRVWKMHQQQLEDSEAAALIKKKETGKIVEEVKEETKIKTVLEIGECGGASFSISGKELLVSGTNCFMIYKGQRWEEEMFEVKTESNALRTLFSTDGQTIYV